MQDVGEELEVQWFYRRWNGRRVGPLTLEGLRAAARAGKLGPWEDGKEICRTDETEWQTVPRCLADTKERIAVNRRNHRKETSFARFAYPCWELVKVYPADFLPVNWPARWQECSGRLYNGRMLARKDSAIWAALGDSARFSDALDIAYPPFVLGGSMTTREVPRDESISLGVIPPDMPQPGDEQKGINGISVADLRTLQAKLEIEIAERRKQLQEHCEATRTEPSEEEFL